MSVDFKSHAAKCMVCGKCSASCPSFSEMDVRPHRFVRELAEDGAQNLENSQSLWKCLSCFACAEKCPRGVDAASVVHSVKLAVARRQGGDRLLQDDIPAFTEDESLPQQLVVAALRR